MPKLDFDIEWRPWRVVYIALIASAILYFTGEVVAAAISLLAYFDVDPEGLKPDEDDGQN